MWFKWHRGRDHTLKLLLVIPIFYKSSYALSVAVQTSISCFIKCADFELSELFERQS